MEDRDDKHAEEKSGAHNIVIGKRGEHAAARYLELKGYEVAELNFTCPAGEADIVAFDGDCLVFCEVKTRTSIQKGFPCEAVTAQKRQRYEKIAAWYLKEHCTVDIDVRFDVIDLLAIKPDRALIRHLVNAFGVV